jgi:peptidoglycan/xylan/chitin deacetylase (PgdA/CDA1 family)
MEGPRQEERALKAVCLLFHDVVEGTDWESSGFTGPGTARYKMGRGAFEAHLAAVASVRAEPPSHANDFLAAVPGDFPFLLTFDDGGISAATMIAGLLEKRGWRGHFFVTAGKVGQKGFLNAAQIRVLKENGHVIGSHSFSHPMRMSYCSREILLDEWTSSVRFLSETVGEPVTTASVPGGYYSRLVGEAAADAGIRVLFTSEPVTNIEKVGECLVLGRFNIFQGAPPQLSAELVSLSSKARWRQWLFWNLKKAGKSIAGRPYLVARQYLLRNG